MNRDVVAYCYALADKWIEDCRKERTKMINDNEGMDNALEYYVDGDNTAYWKEFVRRLDDDYDDYYDYDDEWEDFDWDYEE